MCKRPVKKGSLAVEYQPQSIVKKFWKGGSARGNLLKEVSPRIFFSSLYLTSLVLFPFFFGLCGFVSGLAVEMVQRAMDVRHEQIGHVA